MKSNKYFNFTYVFFALLAIFFLRQYWLENQAVETLAYSDFLTQLKQENVSDLVISEGKIRGKFKNPKDDKKSLFITNKVDTPLAQELGQYKVKFTQEIQSHFFSNILAWVLPLMIFWGIWAYMGRKMSSGAGGGLLSVGKSKAKVYIETDIKTTFADVAGVDEAKEELQEIINFLKDPKSYGILGARMPKGILLVGPPGTGKTLLAKAVAGEAEVPFFSINGSEFVELFVGVGAARVRDLFEQAKSKAPCIVFIDELDSLGRARGAQGMSGGHDEKEQTLNQLLAELDGFDSKTGVIFLAATNRPEILDPALLRAGRFDRQVLVDKPDRMGRKEILGVHCKKIKLSPDISLEEVAGLTPGFTGADLANLVNEAALVATRNKSKNVGMSDFTSAIERIVAGLEKKNRLLNPTERRVVAHHEMGHALVAFALPGSDKVHKVSIIPRGIGSLGYTIQRPTEDRYLMTKEELKNKMSVLLGGRAAEEIVFNHFSTGAADDLSKATDIARGMVLRYGMSEELGPITFEENRSQFLGEMRWNRFQSQNYSDATALKIDTAVRKLVEEASENAKSIIAKNQKILITGASKLLDKETLNQSELKMLFQNLIY